MSFDLIKVLTVQKGSSRTKPAGNDSPPSIVSRPILQVPAGVSTIADQSKPIQQRFKAETNPDGNETSPASVLSRPIEQLGDFIHAPTFPNTSEDALIAQELLITANHSSSPISPKPETPVQQVKFDAEGLAGVLGTSKPLQQRTAETSGDNFSRPVEQVPRIQNSFTLLQFNFINLIFPACGSTKNSVNTNIIWRILDNGFDFNVSSLIFTVDGIQVQDRSGFSVTNIAGGLQIFYDPPEDFDFNREIFLTITIDDIDEPANTFFLRCSWTTIPDVRPPFFRSIIPVCGSTDVDVLAPVSFDVLDFGLGVDPDSIRLSIEGVTVCDGVSLDGITDQDFTTISGIPVGTTATGFHVTYQHPFDPWRYGSNVTIALEARDLSPLQNRVLFVCSFDVIESTAPTFVNLTPEPCDSFVDNRTGLSFEVYGVEHGVDISTLEVRVDNKLRKVFVRPRILRAE